MLAPTAIVFDLDGTLIDSRGDIVAATNHALAQTGRTALPAQVIVRFIGDGARSLCARTAQLPEGSAEVEELLKLFIAYYLEHPLDFTRWVAGAPEALEQLAETDLPLALCTNKARSVTDAILAGLGVRTRFKAIYAGGDGSEKKPAAGPLLTLAKQMGVDPAGLVMVGDGPQDVESARRANCRVIGVVSGFLPKERLIASRPDVIVERLDEIPGIVRRWCDATARLSVVR